MEATKRFTVYIGVATDDKTIIVSLMNLKTNKDFVSLTEEPGRPAVENYDTDYVEIHGVCPSLAQARRFEATVDHVVNMMPTDKQFELHLVIDEASGSVTKNLQKLESRHGFELEIVGEHVELIGTVTDIRSLERLEKRVDKALRVDHFAEEIHKILATPRPKMTILIDRASLRAVELTGVIGVAIRNWRRKITGR